jgi:hypothetical protein
MKSPIIKRAQVQFAGTVSTNTGATPAAPLPTRCTTRKSATLIESGGRPIAIEVTCSCGEKTLVELELPSAESGATPERRSP